MNNGLWRSLVAHYAGGVVAAGSNPVNPTILGSAMQILFFNQCLLYRTMGVANYGRL